MVDYLVNCLYEFAMGEEDACVIGVAVEAWSSADRQVGVVIGTHEVSSTAAGPNRIGSSVTEIRTRKSHTDKVTH